MSSLSETPCPQCGLNGRSVKNITPESLLTNEAKERLASQARLRFCKSGNCDVVYFGANPEETFTTKNLRVSVFQKSVDASRLVCYCFEHTVLSINEEVARDGVSEAPKAIADKCKKGLDRCHENNPQGSCCLGNVRQVVKAATARIGVSDTDSDPQGDTTTDCCSATNAPNAEEPPPKSHAGLWSAGGALFAAVLSSACCWLPLLFVGLGVSVTGLAGFFETYRVLFLGVTALFLSIGFYYIYFRKPRCLPGDSCAAPNPNHQRFNKTMLWLATMMVVVFAAFPNYVGVVLGSEKAPSSPVQEVSNIRNFEITGMTCGGCAEHVRGVIETVPGVTSVNVSYSRKTAQVEARSDVADESIVFAVQELGFGLIRKPGQKASKSL